jgi:hypothetical protein
MGRSIAIVVGAMAALALTGCQLATGVPTHVTQTGARLQGNGRTDARPGFFHFEYARRAADLGTAAGRRTPERGPIPPSTPAQGTVTFGEDVTGLAPGRLYLFRVCGREDTMPANACAATQSFMTDPSAAQDSVVGGYNDVNTTAATVTAAASATGADAEGRLYVLPAKGQIFDGRVTCLRVQGNRATVGALGTYTPNAYDPAHPQVPAADLVTIEDLPAGDKFQHVSVTPGTTPPDCTKGTFDGAVHQNSDFTVHDAP